MLPVAARSTSISILWKVHRLGLISVPACTVQAGSFIHCYIYACEQTLFRSKRRVFPPLQIGVWATVELRRSPGRRCERWCRRSMVSRAPSTSRTQSSSWDSESERELFEQEEMLVLQQVPVCSQSVLTLRWLDCLVASDLTPYMPRLLRRVK